MTSFPESVSGTEEEVNVAEIRPDFNSHYLMGKQ